MLKKVNNDLTLSTNEKLKSPMNKNIIL